MMVELEILKSKLQYDRDTGLFTWLATEFKHNFGDIAGRKNANGYIVIYVNFSYYYAHKLAIWFETGEYPLFVDHKDLNSSNNIYKNLRACTQSQNGFNQGLRISNTSGHKNVSYCKTWKRFTVNIKINRVKRYFGGFKTLEEAILVADKARLDLLGEFARSN